MTSSPIAGLGKISPPVSPRQPIATGPSTAGPGASPVRAGLARNIGRAGALTAGRVGLGVAVGKGVAVGLGVDVGRGVAVGGTCVGVAVGGTGVGVAVG